MAYEPSPKDANKIKLPVDLIRAFFLEEYLFISICASCFYISGTILLQIPPNPVLTSLVFWSTLLIYQVNTKLKINIFDLASYRRLQLIEKRRLFSYFTLLVILALHLPFIKPLVIIYTIHLGVISTLYNVPKNRKSFLPLRSIPLLKVFLISYIWASISVILPTIESEVYEYEMLRIFSAHFLFILSITLPFDIRDFKSDMKNRLLTVPHILGLNGTKGLAIIALSISVLLLSPVINFVGNIIFFGAAAVLIVFAAPVRRDYYFTLLVDGTIIIYFAVVKSSIYY